MNTTLIVTLIILVVVIGIFVALYFVGNKMQKKQMAQKEQLAEAAQQTSMLIIDKKVMKLKEAGLPKAVLEQAPKRYQNAKVPIVKVKIGPQITNMICDEAIFDELPVKGEVKAMVSGIYIVGVKSIRGKKKVTEEQPRKKGFREKVRKKQREFQKEFEQEERTRKEEKEAKAEQKAKKEKAKKITH